MMPLLYNPTSDCLYCYQQFAVESLRTIQLLRAECFPLTFISFFGYPKTSVLIEMSILTWEESIYFENLFDNKTRLNILDIVQTVVELMSLSNFTSAIFIQHMCRGHVAIQSR